MADAIPPWETAWSTREFEPDEVIEEVSCRLNDEDDPGLNWQGNRIPTPEDYVEAEAARRGTASGRLRDDAEEHDDGFA
jgi:hypothetical protein